MSVVLAIAGWTIFGVAIFVALILDLVGLFGNWIILGAVGIAWAVSKFTYFGPWCLLILVAIALLGEGLEFVLAGYGARRFGGSKGSVMAALIGCILGAMAGTPLLPVIGTIIGACAGAFAAAALYEYLQQDRTAAAALWTGAGAALGKVGGILAKFLCGLAMLGVAAASF